MGIPFSHFHAVHPEFLKQEVALKRLTMWEEITGQRFEYIHKLRTDMRYDISFDEYVNPLLSLALARDSLLAFWTLCISGHRDTMLKLAGYTEFCYNFKTDKLFAANILSNVNVPSLRDSTYDQPYRRSYPVAVFKSSPTQTQADFQSRLHSLYPAWFDAVSAFSARLQLEGVPDVIFDALASKEFSTVQCYDQPWGLWISEMPFFYYLNNLGISLHQYAHYPSWRLVKLARHATTPFTEKIFNDIQDSNYTFLSQFHAWDRELESFLALGGAPQAALDKFSRIDLIDLPPHEWCKALYCIIDIINLSDWLLKNQPKFIDSIIAKGIDPPACLQPFLRK